MQWLRRLLSGGAVPCGCRAQSAPQRGLCGFAVGQPVAPVPLRCSIKSSGHAIAGVARGLVAGAQWGRLLAWKDGLPLDRRRAGVRQQPRADAALRDNSQQTRDSDTP